MSEAALAPGYSASRVRGLVPYRGGASGNPTGRPKGEKALARYIRSRTKNGREMVDLMLAIMRGLEPAPVHERLAAISWLANRAFGPAGDSLEPGTTVTIFTLRIGEREMDA